MLAGGPGAPPSRLLRVLVVTEEDPFYVASFVDVFLAEYPRDEFDLIGFTVQRAFNESVLATARRMLRFYGARDFLRLLARFVRAKTRRRSVSGLVRDAGVPILSADSVNDSGYLARVRALRPDVIVSVAAPEIFGPELLAVPRLGCVNVHSGRLPTYRGMMPSFWQMLSRERHVTVTVHEMAERVDAGSVLATVEFPIRERDSLDRVMRETKQESARLLIRVLRDIAAGRARGSPVDMTASSYFSFPQREDVEAFRRLGHRML